MNVNWDKFSKLFINAYYEGDIHTLNNLKHLEVIGFSNLDDFGEQFIKYGSGLYKWNEMIEDSKILGKNKNLPIPLEKLSKLFLKLFNKGDISMLENLKDIGIKGLLNLEDLGEPFIIYGSGLNKWTEMIKDAEENSKSWNKFIIKFHKAFYCGDILTLELLKNICVKGFNSLDDLGQPFLKYGSGFDKWSEMINDANINIQDNNW